MISVRTYPTAPPVLRANDGRDGDRQDAEAEVAPIRLFAADRGSDSSSRGTARTDEQHDTVSAQAGGSSDEGTGDGDVPTEGGDTALGDGGGTADESKTVDGLRARAQQQEDTGTGVFGALLD